jgi:rfaE bifunctional protein kinase chain/domain
LNPISDEGSPVAPGRLNQLLDRIHGVRIGVIGDFCVDAYWQLDTGGPELSLETGKPTRGVRSQRYIPGGGGNVASNLASLGAGTVRAFGVIGPDMFGRELLSLLRERGIDTSGLVMQGEEWETPVYAKPYLANAEQERIDFGRWNAMRSESALAGLVRSALPGLDALVVNQQLARGIHTETMVRTLNEMARDHPGVRFVLDARTMSMSFTGMICKLNAAEAARLTAKAGEGSPGTSAAALRSRARAVGARCGKPVFVTRGAEGMLVFDGSTYTDIPAVPLKGPLDPVGAGDTTVSAIASTLAAGGTLEEAGEMGNMAAAVTVRKTKETGTATGGEVLALGFHYDRR